MALGGGALRETEAHGDRSWIISPQSAPRTGIIIQSRCSRKQFHVSVVIDKRIVPLPIVTRLA